ncbi:MAG TPA: carbon storage regulator CsrA [Gemmataceae bacterium]|nr:carbon storage regulator CsrA [Gemmataceae bacterium]
MLVLSRKKNESIVINNNVTVTVVEIRGEKVRLGIVAPREVPVHRQEVLEAIHGKAAAAEPPLAWLVVVEGDNQYTRFLDQLAAGLRRKTGKPLSRSIVALTLLDAMEQTGVDLSQASSFENLKALLIKAALGDAPPASED